MSEKKKYGVIYDKTGKSIGVSGTVGPIGIQGVCGHPGVAGEPGYPPYVGQFRWCHLCGHVRFFRLEDKNRYWPPDESKKMLCQICKRDTAFVYDAWCPDNAILVWEEEEVV